MDNKKKNYMKGLNSFILKFYEPNMSKFETDKF